MQLMCCVGSSQLTGGDVKSAICYQQALKDLLDSFRNELNEIAPCLLEWLSGTELERSGLSFHIML